MSLGPFDTGAAHKYGRGFAALSVRWVALSITRRATPYRANSQAIVIPTAPAPPIRRVFISSSS
jgi:hypothetical protein